jgi:imidazolonepropionase-like amidohydrolase
MIIAAIMTVALLGGGDVALRADKVWVDGATAIDKGIVLVRDGRVADVGANVEVPQDVQLIECQGHLTAGLVALRAQIGLDGEGVDAARAILPEAKIADAVRRDDPEFARLRAQGITAVVLAPTATKLVPGSTAVAKTTGAMVSDRAHLTVVFGGSALAFNREPTSYARQTEMLAELFDNGPKGAVSDAKNGRLPILWEVQSKPEVRRALEFATARKLGGALCGAPLAGELAEEIAAAKLAVIVPASGAGEPMREAQSVALLAKKGVTFGFGLDAPSNPAQNLRMVAALSLRHGVEHGKALNALTKDAAAIAGMGARAGSVARGMDADLVLWSGDPLELSSAAKAVWVEGALVHGGAQ